MKREVRTLLDTIKCAGEVLENLVGCTTETQMSNVVQQCKKLGITIGDTIPVSYTHLDVYKRQP